MKYLVVLFMLLTNVAIASTVNTGEVKILSVETGYIRVSFAGYTYPLKDGVLITISESSILCGAVKNGNSPIYTNMIFFDSASPVFKQITGVLMTSMALEKNVKIVARACPEDSATHVAMGESIILQSD